MAHSHPFFCHSGSLSVMVSEAEPSAPTIIPTGGRGHPVIPTERSEWRDLLHSLTFHRKRNGKPLMLTKNAFAAFSIPLFFVMVSGGRSPKPNHLLKPQIPRLRSSGPPLGMTSQHPPRNDKNVEAPPAFSRPPEVKCFPRQCACNDKFP